MYVVKTKRTLENGTDKWVTLGAAFDVSADQINVVLDSLPVWPNWDGTIVLFQKNK